MHTPSAIRSSEPFLASGDSFAPAAMPMVRTLRTVKKKTPARIPAKKTTAEPARKKTASPQKPAGKPAKPARRKSVKSRLLWIGDAVAPTGFATVTHAVCGELRRDWEVFVSGINYEGGGHPHPYTILPACQGGDMWGIDRFAALCAEFNPDAVLINNDWWNVAAFLQQAPAGIPIAAYMPVDGRNLDHRIVPQLNRLAAAAWYTDFGWREAVKSGFRGERWVVPHGIDCRRFRPVDQALARETLGLAVPERAFIVGNVNRNQPRKRLDLTIQFFAEWIRSRNIRDAWLLLHCARQDAGWDLESLARFHRIADRILFTGGDGLRDAPASSLLPLVYGSLNVQATTTAGEGWGLTTMEGMACGIPQLVPDWAALGEWAQPALRVPCPVQVAHPQINTIGALPDKEAFIARLDELYRNSSLRSQLAADGMRFTRQAGFQWSSVAAVLDDMLRSAIRSKAKPSSHALAVR